jgi:hypothetical protein
MGWKAPLIPSTLLALLTSLNRIKSLDLQFFFGSTTLQSLKLD